MHKIDVTTIIYETLVENYDKNCNFLLTMVQLDVNVMGTDTVLPTAPVVEGITILLAGKVQQCST